MPLGIYMCISVYMAYSTLQIKMAAKLKANILQSSDQQRSELSTLRLVFIDNLIVCLIGLVELLGTSLAFTINQICSRIDDEETIYELTNEDLKMHVNTNIYGEGIPAKNLGQYARDQDEDSDTEYR